MWQMCLVYRSKPPVYVDRRFREITKKGWLVTWSYVIFDISLRVLFFLSSVCYVTDFKISRFEVEVIAKPVSKTLEF